MKKTRGFLGLILLWLMLAIIPVQAANSSIYVIIDGTPVEMATILKDSTLMVPIDAILKPLNLTMDVNQEAKQVTLKGDHTHIELMLNTHQAKIDGKEQVLDVPLLTKEEKVYVPIRFIAEGVGKKVQWDQKNSTVIIGEFSKEANIEDTFLYFNREVGYTLSFPNSWKNEAIIETQNGTLSVYDKESVEKASKDGQTAFSPVLEIRSSNRSLLAESPATDGYVLFYRDGQYIEAFFGKALQISPETLNTYTKIFNEGQRALGSFYKIDDHYDFVEDDPKNHQEAIQVLNDLLDRFVPENIFKREEVIIYKNPIDNTNLLYLRNLKSEDQVAIKTEATFDENGKLIKYSFKNYWHDLKENPISQGEALKLANDFIKQYVDEQLEVIKIPELYPSLYEENKHETYGDKDKQYVVVVDLEHGFVEYFGMTRD